MDDNSKEPEEQKNIYKMLLVSTMSLEEKKDQLWDLPDEELISLLKKFEADEDHEICSVIKTVLDEKKSDPDCYQFLGLE